MNRLFSGQRRWSRSLRFRCVSQNLWTPLDTGSGFRWSEVIIYRSRIARTWTRNPEKNAARGGRGMSKNIAPTQFIYDIYDHHLP